MRHDREPIRVAGNGALRATALAVALLGLTPVAGRAEVVNRILATVDGEPITLYELRQFAADEMRIRQISEGDPSVLLEALITKQIIDKEFNEQGLKIDQADIDHYIDGIRQRNKISEEQLSAALEQQGVSLEQYRAQIRDEIQRAQLINREIRGKVNVTPEEVERYYEAHLDEYATAEQMAVSHIVLKVPPDAADSEVEAVRERAEEIYAELKGGADFAELARRYSEDAAAESGGALGQFRKGELLDTLEETAAKLEPGQFSQPVRSRVGFHIVRLDERIGASHEPLDTLAEGIKEKLYNAALEERYSRWLREDLRKRHHVEILP